MSAKKAPAGRPPATEAKRAKRAEQARRQPRAGWGWSARRRGGGLRLRSRRKGPPSQAAALPLRIVQRQRGPCDEPSKLCCAGLRASEQRARAGAAQLAQSRSGCRRCCGGGPASELYLSGGATGVHHVARAGAGGRQWATRGRAASWVPWPTATGDPTCSAQGGPPAGRRSLPVRAFGRLRG